MNEPRSFYITLTSPRGMSVAVRIREVEGARSVTEDAWRFLLMLPEFPSQESVELVVTTPRAHGCADFITGDAWPTLCPLLALPPQWSITEIIMAATGREHGSILRPGGMLFIPAGERVLLLERSAGHHLGDPQFTLRVPGRMSQAWHPLSPWALVRKVRR